MSEDEHWMKIAIQEAKLAMSENEVPVGAVLVKNNNLITQAHNQPIKFNDPTAHAEIQVLRKGGNLENNYRLIGSTLYVTLEPCVMCLGAIMHARISRLVYGAYDHKYGACGSSKDLINEACFNHKVNISGGILEPECKELLQKFFKKRRFLD